MPFGFGFSPPNLKIAAGAAAVVPMVVKGQGYSAATTYGGDVVGAVQGATLPALSAGDKLFMAYCSDVNLGMSVTSSPVGVSAPTQIAAPTSADANWFIYSFDVTSAVTAGQSVDFDANGTPLLYTYGIIWAVSGANSTVPYEAGSATISATTGATNPRLFNVTTGNANDCVLCVVYATPMPTLVDANYVLTWNTTTPGWTSGGPAADGGGSGNFYFISNPNVATATTTAVSSNSVGGATVLRFNIKK